MDTETARAAIADHFKSGWTGPTVSGIPVNYPNTKFSQPTSGHWARLSMQLGDREAVAIGGGRKRQIGILVLQIFAPENGGTATAYKAADHFAGIFDQAQLTPAPGLLVEFENTGVAGPFTNQGFFQLNATVAFRVDKSS